MSPHILPRYSAVMSSEAPSLATHYKSCPPQAAWPALLSSFLYSTHLLLSVYMIYQVKNWCFWTAVLEKTLESHLDCKEIQPVHPKGHQSWIFIRRTDAEAETPILWSPDAKNWLIEKDPDAGKDWRQEEKGMTEDEMVGWHHGLNWTWVGTSSGSWWWTEKPGVLQSIGSQRVRHDWATQLNWMFIVCLSTLKS